MNHLFICVPSSITVVYNPSAAVTRRRQLQRGELGENHEGSRISKERARFVIVLPWWFWFPDSVRWPRHSIFHNSVALSRFQMQPRATSEPRFLHHAPSGTQVAICQEFAIENGHLFTTFLGFFRFGEQFPDQSPPSVAVTCWLTTVSRSIAGREPPELFTTDPESSVKKDAPRVV